ncbi:MAG TPA: hypothetical protein VGJ00_08170 [Rhabdochlamydiaceae bacterium]|jgi:hypothetical protein
MELQIIAFYFFADGLLKARHLYDDPQAKMANAEIITTVLTYVTISQTHSRSHRKRMCIKGVFIYFGLLFAFVIVI